MRISTASFYENASGKISDLQSALSQKQTQIASGKRILTPADDPVAAAAALDVSQAQAVNTQFAANRDTAKNALQLQESTLTRYTDLLQNVRALSVEAGNGTLDDSQRKFLASELSGTFDDLVGVANTRDSAGNYIFSGFKTTVQPFVSGAAGVGYAGDQGQRLLQVSSARQLSLNDSGDAVFQNVKTGNGNFATAAAGGNSGSGIAGPGTITNATALTNHSYSIDFTGAGASAAFKVYDVTLDPTKTTPLPASGAYVSGQSIAFDGLQFDISGAPNGGDKFTVQPSTNQSIFKTVSDLIATLNVPAGGAAGQASLAAGVRASITNVSNALDTALTVRASGGARLKELDSLDSEGSDRNLQYAARLSSLQDLDYAKAITELTQQQVTLQAAQQSFVKIANLSLFDYLR